MSWAKLDDRMHDDDRSLAAGVDAMGLWAMALSYMADRSTDGEITAERVQRIAGKRGANLAARLVAAGWWETTPTGWRLIPWGEYLISRSEVEANRVRKSEFGRRGGVAKAAKEANTCLAPCQASASAAVLLPIPTRSRPDPDPEKKKEETPTPSGVGGVSLGQMAEGGQVLPLPGFEGLPAPQAALEESIFAAYLEGRAKHVAKGSPPVLDEPRRKMIRGRLAAGFTADDLRAAARGIWLSDWHVENKRTGFELCMRSAEAVERCRGFALDGPELGDDSDPCPPEPAPRPLRYPPGMKPGDPVDPATLRMLAERFPACAPTIEGMLSDG